MTVQVLRDPPLRHLLYIIGGRLRPNVGRSLLFLNLLRETCPRGQLRDTDQEVYMEAELGPLFYELRLLDNALYKAF